MGIIDAAGTIRVHLGKNTGSVYMPNAGVFIKMPVATSAFIPAGKYYIAITSNCTTTCATIGGVNGGFTFLINNETVSTAGDLTGIPAPAADAPTTGVIPVFYLH